MNCHIGRKKSCLQDRFKQAIIGNCSESVKKWFFYFLQQFIWKSTWMLLRQFHLSNNLVMLIKEDTDFPWQNPWQLSSAEVKFEGCEFQIFISYLHKIENSQHSVHSPFCTSTLRGELLEKRGATFFKGSCNFYKKKIS